MNERHQRENQQQNEEVQAAIQCLVAWGLGTEEHLQQVSAQRRHAHQVRQMLVLAFPNLSEQECEDCVARHLERWKGTSSNHAAW